jgi:hypothetical protein
LAVARCGGEENMREAMIENGPLWLAIGGLVIGLFFGAIVFRTNFCTMGSVSDTRWP